MKPQLQFRTYVLRTRSGEPIEFSMPRIPNVWTVHYWRGEMLLLCKN